MANFEFLRYSLSYYTLFLKVDCTPVAEFYLSLFINTTDLQSRSHVAILSFLILFEVGSLDRKGREEGFSYLMDEFSIDFKGEGIY